MPDISKGSKILVSGASGYIGMWVVRTLLERGYVVRGTVRTPEKGRFLADYFQKLGFGGDRLEFVIVEDMIKGGAFDEAVKGVDAIEHTASPFHFKAVDPQEIIGPAVQGTVNILKSALEYGTQVKRIIITSSVAAVLSSLKEPTVFTEKDWNTVSINEVEELGEKSAAITKYRASKTMAEKAAWGLYDEHKSRVIWDLVTILPPFVFGPPIHDVDTPASFNTSLQLWHSVVANDAPRPKDFYGQTTSGWVDVRDAALAHVLALEKIEAGGERIIISAGGHSWQGWLDAANSLPATSRALPKGHPGTDADYLPLLVALDTTKEQRILGIKYRTKVETTKDMLEQFDSKGW